MLAQMEEVQAQLDTLVGALDGHDAGAIIAATEALATAVILFRGAPVAEGGESRAKVLIEQVLGQLEAAAIRINILKNWTRQRIDNNHQVRGIQTRGTALTY
ncbi:hypothetical protein FHR22_004419 [Sphingopyxis panaciterrae]|uniref:hypothetical protein n=1 Tax=Sphingopyxis panaciterrae TaxID=363841 RepID=UPI001421A8E4|nr:hypothetical protein [Sphingopyxis panaciterrae]NIJ39664.1 hypothetical protein [Sphingopyxis panaciterrae]